MSRIGKKPMTVPSGVKVEVAGKVIKVAGPKGKLERPLHPLVALEINGSTLELKKASADTETTEYSKYSGMMRTSIQNMLVGVTTGFTKSLTMVGVGYRAAQNGKNVTLTLGYSHPIEFVPPAGVEVKVDKQTGLIVTGAEKETVGQVAAQLRAFRAPEPYHGKGVRYSDEVIATKVGKAAGKAK